jgi:magnesium chelatase family protein
MSTRDIKKYCPLSNQCRTMMMSATASMNLTARSYFKVIKIARTIADIAGDKKISTTHLAEALQYRPKDEEY